MMSCNYQLPFMEGGISFRRFPRQDRGVSWRCFAGALTWDTDGREENTAEGIVPECVPDERMYLVDWNTLEQHPRSIMSDSVHWSLACASCFQSSASDVSVAVLKLWLTYFGESQWGCS